MVRFSKAAWQAASAAVRAARVARESSPRSSLEREDMVGEAEMRKGKMRKGRGGSLRQAEIGGDGVPKDGGFEAHAQGILHGAQDRWPFG